LVYPPDKVLLPPNMNVIEVHFMPGANNTIFEIDFTNALTDVRLETTCNTITNTRGSDTGGCGFQLDQTDWNYVASVNRGGEPVTVTVRAAPSDLSCVSGSNSREINYATEDIAGGIYYWQSIVQGGVAGKTGGIYRKDFGDASPTSQPFLTPTTVNKCVGCHFLSRDGLRMTFGSDDADSDDEYGDLHVNLYDVEHLQTLSQNGPAGFQSFNSDHSLFLSSDGKGQTPGSALLRVNDGETGVVDSAATFATLAGKRLTHPDWSHDGTMVYFTAATVLTQFGSYHRIDDIHVTNGSIYAASYNTVAGTFGTPSVLVAAASADENNYYPALSPDGTTLVFNRATGTTLEAHDSFNNANANLYALPVEGLPILLAKANLHDGLTNSWPRWSPFVQMYKGKRILWITFSSTRDYGLRVQNESPPDGPLVNCYPPESPENPDGSHQDPFPPNCTQPEIWMAAVALDDIASGTDGSFPAFWLPFQDYNAHNHIAQWTETIVPPPQGCQGPGQSCESLACCDGEECDALTVTCQTIIY